MSSLVNIPIHNNTRYEVNMESAHQHKYIVYKLNIVDLAIGTKYLVKFRFSEIKKLHEDVLKKYKDFKQSWPELPKTNSFALWNRTNNDHRKIQQRRRQLQYYFDRILNNSTFSTLSQIKMYLMDSSKTVNRAQSSLPTQFIMERRRAKSTPSKDQLKQKNSY